MNPPVEAERHEARRGGWETSPKRDGRLKPPAHGRDAAKSEADSPLQRSRSQIVTLNAPSELEITICDLKNLAPLKPSKLWRLEVTNYDLKFAQLSTPRYLANTDISGSQ